VDLGMTGYSPLGTPSRRDDTVQEGKIPNGVNPRVYLTDTSNKFVSSREAIVP